MGRTRPASGSVLLRLGARELDDLGPFLGFVGHKPPELGGRHRHWIGAETFDPSLELRIGKARTNIAVELVDDSGRGAPGRADANPTARLVVRDKFRDRWQVR